MDGEEYASPNYGGDVLSQAGARIYVDELWECRAQDGQIAWKEMGRPGAFGLAEANLMGVAKVTPVSMIPPRLSYLAGNFQ